jgi:hypothetical protein
MICFAFQLPGQTPADEDLKEHATVLAASGTALENGNAEAAKKILVLTKESLIYQLTCHANGSVILRNQRNGPRYFLLKSTTK